MENIKNPSGACDALVVDVACSDLRAPAHFARECQIVSSPPPPVTHARVPESKGERRRRERDSGNRGEKEEKRDARERERDAQARKRRRE